MPAPAPPVARGAARFSAVDWHLLDPTTDSVAGAGVRRAMTLLAGRTPQRQVLVAVIDGGVDTAHVAIRPALSTNAREVPRNGRDDEGNGYVDDVRGWNFMGTPDGRSYEHDQLELTRLVARCRAKQPITVGVACDSLENEWRAAKAEDEGQWQQLKPVLDRYDEARAELAKAVGTTPDKLTTMQVEGLPGTGALASQRAFVLSMASRGLTPGEATSTRRYFEGRVQHNFNLAADPRAMMGDWRKLGRRYGNADVTGPDAAHGTAVAGVIAGAPGDSGSTGIMPTARILAIRAVPNGDERDEDVANAIRYAVDRGASVINMSFGKPYSPGKAMVDSAVAYAVGKGVLLVHAAGNEASDNDAGRSYPTAAFLGDAGRAATWLEVGANGPRIGRTLPARFSNYGRTTVDLFAPGTDIFMPKAGGGWVRESGTSFAAPVVSGVAALLLSYFPTLTAADVKRLLLASVVPLASLQVDVPGQPGRTAAFGTLSTTGGIVNAYNAVKMALDETARTTP